MLLALALGLGPPGAAARAEDPAAAVLRHQSQSIAKSVAPQVKAANRPTPPARPAVPGVKLGSPMSPAPSPPPASGVSRNRPGGLWPLWTLDPPQ
jgi:hypothetical protein